MYEVILSCADCDEQLDVIVTSLDELDRLACECGEGSTIESISAYEEWRRPPRLRAIDPAADLGDEDLPRAA